jgi:hypothetical protein
MTLKIESLRQEKPTIQEPPGFTKKNELVLFILDTPQGLPIRPPNRIQFVALYVRET